LSQAWSINAKAKRHDAMKAAIPDGRRAKYSPTKVMTAANSRPKALSSWGALARTIPTSDSSDVASPFGACEDAAAA
jgi:hypothetical protein